MVQVITCIVGMLETNCHIVFDTESRLGFVVDPADDVQKILECINENNIKVTHIFLTHGHFDHILALSKLKDATNAKVCIHALDEPKLKSKTESLYYHVYSDEFPTVDADILLNGGETIEIGGINVSVIHTPGHTVGSVCYDTGDVLLSGDTLFRNSCGRTDFPDGNTHALLKSLRFLGNIKGDRKVFSGHGEPTLLSVERKKNPYLIQAMNL